MTHADALYPPQLVEHGKHPCHAQLPADPTHRAVLENPLCGDRLELALRLEAGAVTAVGHRTEGCLLCKAAASMMSQRVLEASTETARSLAVAFRALVEGRADPAASSVLAELGAFAPLAHNPMRRECALLPWSALTEALTGTTASPR